MELPRIFSKREKTQTTKEEKKEEKPRIYEYPKTAIFRKATLKSGAVIKYTVIKDENGVDIPVDENRRRVTDTHNISEGVLVNKWLESVENTTTIIKPALVEARKDAKNLEAELSVPNAAASAPTPKRIATASPAPVKGDESQKDDSALFKEYEKKLEKVYASQFAAQKDALDESTARIKTLEGALEEKDGAHKAELARQKETMEKAYVGQLKDALAEQKKALAEVHMLQCEIAAYQHKLKEQDALMKECEDYKTKLSALEKDYDAKLAKQEEAHKEQLAGQEEEKKTLELHLETVKSDLQKSQGEYKRISGELEGTKALYQKSCTERDALMKEREEYKIKLSAQEKDYDAELSKQEETYKKQLDEQAAIIKNYEARITSNREALLKAIKDAESRLPQAEPKKPVPIKEIEK